MTKKFEKEKTFNEYKIINYWLKQNYQVLY